jgi:hypothetical protein
MLPVNVFVGGSAAGRTAAPFCLAALPPTKLGYFKITFPQS